MAAATRGPGSEAVRHTGYLLAAWTAELLGEAEASADWLTLLRDERHSEADELRLMIGALEACLGARRFERAQITADWILEAIATGPHARAEVLLSKEWAQRAEGDYAGATATLERVEAELEAMGTAGLETGLRADIASRLHLGRAHRWLSLGVLDRAADELGQSLSQADRATSIAPRVAATLAYSDLSMLQGRRPFALELVDRLLDDHGDELHEVLLPPIWMQRAGALAEVARIDPTRVDEALAELRSLEGRLDVRPDLALRARLDLADLLLAGDPDTAELEEAAALLADVPTTGPGLESVAHATSQRARLALASATSGDELDEVLAETAAAHGALLEDWRRSPRGRRGGLGFFQVSYRRMLIASLVDLELAHAPGAPGLERALDWIVATQREGVLVNELGGPATATFTELRRALLDAEHGCLLFLPGRHGTHLFAFDSERGLHRRLPARVLLLDTLTDFVDALYQPPERRDGDGGALAARLGQLSDELSELLFDDELRALLDDWQHVTVVGSELMKGLPLECLPLRPQGPLLGLTHAIDAVPSLPLAGRLKELALTSPEPARTRLLLLGDLDPVQGSTPLSAVPVDELRPALLDLAAPLGQESAVVLGGPDAHLAALAERLSNGSADLLHVVAHGAYDRDRERGAALALRLDANDDEVGRVFAEDIEALPGCPPVVVLSACAAARGPERLGSDNLSHLGGAFLRAGARCVVLTRANIRLGRTLRMQTALHRHIAAGDTVAEALRKARVEVLAALGEDPFAPYMVGRIQAYGWGSARLRTE